MRIVVTGGMGFIGQNLARYLRQNCPDVHLTSIDWFEGADVAEKAAFDEAYVSCFSDDRIMDLYRSADILIHLAAYSTVQGSIADPQRCFLNNVVKTNALLEFLRLNTPDTKVIFASSGGAILGNQTGAIHENLPAKPLSPYGASKLAVEGLLSAYTGSYGMSTASLRFSNVYGPHSLRQDSVITRFCKSYLTDGRLQVFGDGKQTRDYMYVDDVSEAVLRVIQKDIRGTYQLGTGTATSVLDLVRIFQSLGKNNSVRIEHYKPLPGEVRHNRADITRMKQDIGFVPSTTVEQGIHMTLAWLQDILYPSKPVTGQLAGNVAHTDINSLH